MTFFSVSHTSELLQFVTHVTLCSTWQELDILQFVTPASWHVTNHDTRDANLNYLVTRYIFAILQRPGLKLVLIILMLSICDTDVTFYSLRTFLISLSDWRLTSSSSCYVVKYYCRRHLPYFSDRFLMTTTWEVAVYTPNARFVTIFLTYVWRTVCGDICLTSYDIRQWHVSCSIVSVVISESA